MSPPATSTMALIQVALVFSICVPLIAIAYHILAIRLLLMREGVKSPFSILLPHQHLLDLQRIRAGDTSGLSLSAVESLNGLRTGLFRSFQALGAWLIVVFIALYFLR